MPGALIRENTVKSFILASELAFSRFRNVLGRAPENGKKRFYFVTQLETILNVLFRHSYLLYCLNESDALLCFAHI